MKQKPLSLMGIVLHVKGALFMNLFCLVSHLRLTCLWTESRITRCHASGSFDSEQCPVDFFQQQAILPGAHSLKGLFWRLLIASLGRVFPTSVRDRPGLGGA